jgi:hypothetical protein
VKRTHLAAILVPLALALPSCGGDDSNESTAPAADTSPSAAAERPQSNSQQGTGGGAQANESTPSGSGGSTSADAKRAAKQRDSGKKGSGSKAPTAPRPNRKPAKPKTPQQHIAALSPSERRKLNEDLYQQGKQACYSFGPKELAKSYNLPSTDPETVARLYARAYEAATPTLVLPYQQGCLAGFRKFARDPPT